MTNLNFSDVGVHLARASMEVGSDASSKHRNTALTVLLTRSVQRLEGRVLDQAGSIRPVTERVVRFRGPRAFSSMRLYLHIAHARHLRTAYDEVAEPARVLVLYIYGGSPESTEAEFIYRHMQAQMFDLAEQSFVRDSQGLSFRRYMRHFAVGFGGELSLNMRAIESEIIDTVISDPGSARKIIVLDEDRAIAGLRTKFPSAADRWYNVDRAALVETTIAGRLAAQ